ncbi:hypothetical protein L6452_40282 [Arctium lappa]|uniref:Uncharacterized protein n=1 Tax=Arctium lappa TaxID=4217 RepID=A0ACB8XKW9_ARCLA|nr:hypothetical protein L6452_40282 [Arctium lappa]
MCNFLFRLQIIRPYVLGSASVIEAHADVGFIILFGTLGFFLHLLMETTTSSEEVLVCQTCGDEGYTNAFVYCVKCLGFVVHRYCLDVIPRTSDEFVSWFCEDCNPAVTYQFTSPKLESLQSQKEYATSSANVKTTHDKKKRKMVPLVAGKDVVSCQEEAIEPDRECVLKEASLTSDSGCNQITPCVVSQLEEGVLQKQASEPSELNNNCSPPKRSAKKKRNASSLVKSDSGHNQITSCVVSRLEKGDSQKQASESAHLDKGSSKRKGHATSLAVKTKEHKTRKTVHSVEPSECDSSCTNLTLKDKEGMIRSVEEQRCEIQQSQTDHDKLVSDSSSVELTKKTKDYDGQIETANQMQYEQEMSVSKAGADAYMSTLIENNAKDIHYLPARPVLDPVWRGSFNITETDYDLFEGFVGHLSTKACYKVCEEARVLPSLLRLEMQPKTTIWPKSFVESQPSDEHIALYFFPGNTKNERAFERLVMDMIDEELAMRATAKNAELLIFTSTVLPQSHWRFQGNYYLWGVFRAKQKDSSSHVNQDLAVSNNSVDHYLSENSLNEVTSGEKIRASVKPFDSRSPQSPLCNYRLPMAQNNTLRQNTLRFVLEKEKLNRMNFINWYCALRIVLKAEKKLYVLEQPIPKQPDANASRIERDAFKKHEEDACDVSCLMLISMEPELQKQYENMVPFDMIEHLKLLFQEQVRHERYETSKQLFSCKLAERSPVAPHVHKMVGYIKRLKGLGFPLRNELAIDFVLQSLPDSYHQFVMNYKIQDLESSLPELLNMLRTVEQKLSRSKLTIPMVPSDKRMKGEGKPITKFASKALRPKGAIKKKHKGNIPKEGECFHCNKPGHWKRNCPLYLEEKKKGGTNKRLRG